MQTVDIPSQQQIISASHIGDLPHSDALLQYHSTSPPPRTGVNKSAKLAVELNSHREMAHRVRENAHQTPLRPTDVKVILFWIVMSASSALKHLKRKMIINIPMI
jgi:hypothetical protein